MDEGAIEKAGIAPIQPLLDGSPRSTVTPTTPPRATFAHLHAVAVFRVLPLEPQQDFADATQVIAGFDQAASACPIATTTSRTRAT